MPRNWNKGLTKETNPSVLKISMAMRGRDNFKGWRDKMKKEGKIKSSYLDFKKDGDLAELIGVVLGDGNINVYPRTEGLLIFSNSNNQGFVKRYSTLVEKIFKKNPSIQRLKSSNCTRIRLYEKFISKRLGVPSGARKNLEIAVPDWIFSENKYILRYLRGLYEAEGSFFEHAKTYTHKAFFTNRNKSLLDNVHILLKKLGFNPSKKTDGVQLSRKDEIAKFRKSIKFREY